MIDGDLEYRLERLFAGYAGLPVDTDASWRRFARLRRHAAIRRRVIAAGATVAAVTVVAAALAYQGPSKEPSSRGHVSREAGGRIAIAARIRPPGARSGPGDTSIGGKVVAQSGQVWEASYAGRLFRIDQRANRVVFHEYIAGLQDITAGAGAVWVLTAPHGSFGPLLLKLDPATGHVVARFPLARRCQQVSYGGTQLWLTCGTGTTDFLRINPATGHVIAVAGPARGVANVAATSTGIWYVGNSGISGFVGTGARLRWVNVVDAAYPVSFSNTESLIYAQGALWALTTDESVAKIDPATGMVIRTYGYQTYDPGYSSGLDFMAVGLGSLWFLEDGSRATGVLRVSMATGRPQGSVSGAGSCGEPCWQIYLAGGSVWVPTETHVTRIDPVSHPPRRTGSR